MKKFLQKSCAWLVMLVAMFAMSGTAMAQDKVVTFDMTDADCYSQMTLGTWGTGWTNGYTMGVGSELGFEEIEMWGEGSGSCTVQSGNNRIYLSGNVSLTIASKNDAYKIQSIEFVSSSTSTYPALFNDSKISNDYQSYNWYYYETYEADEPVESVTFSQSSGYSYLKQIKISLVSGNVDPIEYTVNFTGDVPAGCSASYGDDTFTSNGSFEVAKNLKKEDLNITTTADYYADVTLEGTTFNVEFKHWYTYNVTVSGHMMGALEYDGNYYANDDTFKSKTVVDESAFSAYDLNGYDESVSVTQESEYVYNVAVTYTESAPITYTVTFNIVPEGAYAWIKGVKYEANATFQSNLELSYINIEQVYCPEGYYHDSYYSASDHTFYINYIEYDKFYVVVEGTEDPEAGVKYNYGTYHDGDIIYTNDNLTYYFDYYVTPITVAGYNVQVSLNDHTITATYTEKPVPTAPWTTNLYADFEDYTVVDNNDDGRVWAKDADDNGRISYTYSSYNNADDYFILTPVLLEGGKTYDVTVNCRAYNTNWGAETMEVVYGLVNDVEDLTSIAISNTEITWTSYKDLTGQVTIPTTGKYYFALHATTPADRYYLYAKTFSITEAAGPVEAPEFPVEGVGYAIQNVARGTFLNVKEHASEAVYLAADSEPLYFTWNEMKAAFTIQDADGNYFGTSSANLWNMSSTTPEYWTVEEISTGQYAFKSMSSKYLGFNDSATDNRAFRDKEYTADGIFTIAIPVPDTELTVTEAGWTTFCSPSNVALADGYTAYIVTAAENGAVTLKALEAGEAVTNTVAFNSSNNNIVDGKLTDGTVSVAMDGMVYYNYWGEFYKYGNATLTISAPEGCEITKVSFDRDGYYTQPTWPDGTTDMTYSPSSSTNEVEVTMSAYDDYVYFYGITIEYTAAAPAIIPAGAGVLVAGPAGTDIPYTKKPGATPSDVTGNLLVGCTADATWSEAGKSYYKFSLNAANEAGSEGFYWGVDGGASINAHAGKAYLVLDADAASNGRYLINGFEGEPTGIDTVLSTEAAEAIYNLQGQRVNATKAGVYVKGGKKIIVK